MFNKYDISTDTDIKHNKDKHSSCKVCGDIGSYYDDNDKLVKCCDPKTDTLKVFSKPDNDNYLIDKKMKYDKYMMDTASIWKQLSVCKRNQVGCVIGTDDGRILVNGYNGTVTGIANDCEVICDLCHGTKKQDNDQPFDDMYNCCRKCGGSGIITTKFVVHAEQNAITFAAKEGIKLKGTTLYTTTSPCPDCAKLIASSGIKRVLYLDEYKDTSGVDFLNHCGVSCYKI